jgi:hypothetical protein
MISSEEKLVDTFTPPDFELAARCGELLNTVFCTMIFAPGCPILLWFCFVNLALVYWCDKFLLLRISMRPPAWDQVRHFFGSRCAHWYQVRDCFVFFFQKKIKIPITLYHSRK